MARILTARPRRTIGSRRKTVWLDFVSTFTATQALAAGASILMASLNAAALSLRPFTIVRSRGMLWMATDQVAATEDPFGALGSAIVSDQASAIGITAIPTPWTDAGSSLFFQYQMMMANLQFSTAVAYTNVGRTWEIDSKAMRKVDIGQDLVLVAENGNAAHGLRFGIAMRYLIKTN